MRGLSEVWDRLGGVARRRRGGRDRPAAHQATERIRSRLSRLELLEQRVLLSIGPALFEELAATAETPSRSLAETLLIESQGVSAGPYVAGHGVWLDFNPGDGLDLGAEASVEILSSSSQGLVGQVIVPGVWLQPLTLDDIGFTQLTIPDSGYTSTVGEPQLPIIRQSLVVPEGAEGAEVTAAMTGQPRYLSMVDVGLNNSVVPVQASVEKLPGALEAATLDFDQAAYRTDGSTIETDIRVVESGYLGGERLVMLEIAPIAYNPVQEQLVVYDTLAFQISFKGGEAAVPGLSAGDAGPPAEFAPSAAAGSVATAGKRLLVVAHDDFADELDGYVAHKTNLGWTVDLVDTTTTGSSNTQIQSYIKSRYEELSTRPDAVLLVGDTDRIPHFVGLASERPATDLYYTTMDGGDDWYPEFPVGRFSVADSDQLAAVVNKTIAYETSSGDWTRRAAFLAGNDNYRLTEGTHNWVIENHMEPLGYTSDKLYEQTYSATTQDVRDVLNAGRALAIYSGHGSKISWADGPVFSQSDVWGLSNSGMYPLVASFACQTGSYAYAASESFMETWLREPEAGAVVAVGASANSYWNEDDFLEKKLFDAIYDEGYAAYGAAWLRAKELYLLRYGPGLDRTRRYFEMYNVLGDPTVEVFGVAVGITSPSELPPAYQGEDYQYALSAGGGVEPYAWELIAGSLPDGLLLDPETGVIGGTATTPGTETFAIQVTDAGSSTGSKEFELTVAPQLEITTPAELPTGFLDLPYSETLAARGGSTPYAWSLVGVDQYQESDPGPGYLGGGTAMGWQADNASWPLDLPWEFPFYDDEYGTAYVSSNGFLDFAFASAEYDNSSAGLRSNVRIAPLWDNLVTSNGDIYVTQTGDYVAIRWDGETSDAGHPVDFEAVLYRDGRIQFNYGQAHVGLSPTIGVSNGDGSNYTLSFRDGAGSIPANVSSLFEHGGLLPEGLSFDGLAGQISGTPTEEGSFELTFRVQDNGTPQQTDTKDFTLEVLALPSITVGLPAAATEGDDELEDRGTVSVPFPVNGDMPVWLSSDDLSEVTLPPTATILSGRTSATFDLEIEDDAVLDGTQIVTITGSAFGYRDGSAALAVHDNETATLTLTLPESATEGDGLLEDQATVSVSAVPASDVMVTLDSDDPSEATVPATVIIPAGENAATFDLTIVDDTLLDGMQIAAITARVENWTGGAGTIEVLDNDLHHFRIDPIADPQTVGVPFDVTILAKDINDETIEVFAGAVDLTGAGDGGPVPIEVISPLGDVAAAGAGTDTVLYEPIGLQSSSAEKSALGVYHNYSGLMAHLNAYATAHPEISRLVSIGQSVEGRELWAMKITDNPDVEEDEPEVKYVSTMHGNEQLGTEMSLYLIDLLLSEYGNASEITELVDETEIWILPLMNPDGREAGIRRNADGYDLNRSFPEGAFIPIGNILDGPPMDIAGRPPEVAHVMQWSARQSFVLSADFHTGALVVNYPYDNAGLGNVDSPTPDDALFRHLSKIYSFYNPPMWNSSVFPDGITNGAEWYTIAGGMQDWNYRYLGTNEVTVELSTVKRPSESTIPEFWANNRESMLAYLESVHMGVRGLVTDAVTGLPVFGSVTVEGNTHPVFTDPDVGDYHRMLLPGTYDLTFSAPGYAGQTIQNVVVGEGSVASIDVPLVPLGAGVVLVGGQWTGQLAMHAVDTNVVLTADDGLGHIGTSNAFDVLPTGSFVADRHIFYNNSSWDSPAVDPHPSHDAAIAPDKLALLPGGTATFENYTSYSRGINGIMVDIHNLPDALVTEDDFQFKVGNDNDPDDWDLVTAEPAISVRRGNGTGGSDRVTIIFPDNAIQKQWLQITVLAGEGTGLVEDDVFYFGNAIGESGNSTPNAIVNVQDILLTRSHPHPFWDPAPLDDQYDFDRDGRVNAADILIARSNQTWSLDALKLIDLSGEAVVPGGGKNAVGPGRASVRDAVFASAAAHESSGRGISPGKIDWLYEFEQAGTPRAPAGRHKPVATAVDKLLAS